MEIYLALRPKLERVIARRVGSKTLASDLAQDMYFRIGAIKSPLANRGDAERYFLRVAMNASLDHMKVASRRTAILDESAPVFQHQSASPEADVLAKDEMRVVEAALAELPGKCRDVLLLSRVEGLSHSEIAAKLGVSRSLVEKYIVRSLLHCRRRLAAESERK